MKSSETSRDVTATLLSFSARACAAGRWSTGTSRGLRDWPPCGGTNFDISSSISRLGLRVLRSLCSRRQEHLQKTGLRAEPPEQCNRLRDRDCLLRGDRHCPASGAYAELIERSLAHSNLVPRVPSQNAA